MAQLAKCFPTSLRDRVWFWSSSVKRVGGEREDNILPVTRHWGAEPGGSLKLIGWPA